MNRNNLEERYRSITSQIPSDVDLVAVSKTHSTEKILEVYQLGQRIFGENKVQELTEKQLQLPKDILWHMIGHLQTNKVKYIAPFIDTIQSVDSEKLLEEIDRHAAKNNRKIKVLLQVKIAEEETKTGLEISETKELLLKYVQGNFPNVEVTGLMGMATFTNDKDQLQREFSFLKRLFDQMKLQHNISVLSMGMSDDFPIAIECGANSVRIGSAIFGDRNYDN